MAQKNYPKKGDWYSEVRNILKEYDMKMSDEEIKIVPKKLDVVGPVDNRPSTD